MTEGAAAMAEAEAAAQVDPRVKLADWVNGGDEWVRSIVREVLSTGRPLSADAVAEAYRPFRQEKALDARALPPVPLLAVDARADDAELPLVITSSSDVSGVNAIVPGCNCARVGVANAARCLGRNLG